MKITKSLKTLLAEYKQVSWPSLKTTINMTLFVIIVSAIITLFILLIDAFLFDLRSRFVIS